MASPPTPPANTPLKMASAAPTRKVAAGGLGGAISVIVIAVVHSAFHVDIDPTVASAITIVVSFLLGYFVPPAATDTPVPA